MEQPPQVVMFKDLPALKKAYEIADAAGCELFKFKGMDIYTQYAKYLIQYMEEMKKKAK